MSKQKTISKGKIVDTWYYQYDGVHESDSRDAQVEQIKIPIEVRICKKYKDSDKPPLATKEVWFSISCNNPQFAVSGPDIEALRASMWEKLDTHFAVKWEPYCLVEVEHRAPYAGLGSGLCFSYKDIERGVAYDGTLLMRTYEYSRGPVITPWPGKFKDDYDRVIACIPKTPENHNALKEFTARIDQLREALSDLIRPQHIMKTLQSLSTLLPALPAPE
jgi:hypothetical protein